MEASDRKRCIAAGALANLIQQLHQGSRLDLIGHYLSGQVWILQISFILKSAERKLRLELEKRGIKNAREILPD